MFALSRLALVAVLSQVAASQPATHPVDTSPPSAKASTSQPVRRTFREGEPVEVDGLRITVRSRCDATTLSDPRAPQGMQRIGGTNMYGSPVLDKLWERTHSQGSNNSKPVSSPTVNKPTKRMSVAVTVHIESTVRAYHGPSIGFTLVDPSNNRLDTGTFVVRTPPQQGLQLLYSGPYRQPLRLTSLASDKHL